MSKVPTKLTPEEIKLRASLLAKNKDLLKLHKDLVFSSILSEEEFWEDRKGLLRAQEMILKQKKGVTSALVADDLKPVTGGASDVKYILTPTIIQTIFEQHSILKKAFNDLVATDANPSGALTEREFWLEYFKSKFFNESQKTSNTGSVHLDPYFQETATNLTDSAYDSHVKVSGQCDISRSEEDHVSDYVRYEREAAANGTAWNSLRQFNKHSLRVLQALKSSDNTSNTSNTTSNAYNYIEIPDLQQFQAPAMATLNLQESQLFTGSSKTSTNTTANDSVDVKGLVKSLDTCKFDASAYQLNYSDSKVFFSQLLQSNNYTHSGSQTTVTNSESSASEDQLQLINSCTELLRHFWKSASISAKMTADRSAKLTRLISVLEKMEEKIVDHKVLGNLKEVICRAKVKYSELVQ